MPLPKTFVASPEWIAGQDPRHWLTDPELEVWGSWTLEKRRSEWLAGRLAAKKLLWDELDLAPPDWSVGRDGVAPAVAGWDLPNITLSLSHSAGCGAATFSEIQTEGSAGIDIQRIRPVHPGLCARVFTARERKQIALKFGSENSIEGMLLFWALKEAAIKARRQAWERPLRGIEVRLGRRGMAAILLDEEPLLSACYERLGEWWLARAVRNLPRNIPINP